MRRYDLTSPISRRDSSRAIPSNENVIIVIKIRVFHLLYRRRLGGCRVGRLAHP